MTDSPLPAPKPGRDIAILLDIMARLRAPGGCPWDRAQTFATIAPYTIEEAYEVASAIQDGDLKALAGELGDLLLQVVFHARMAQEAGLFDFGDVVGEITAKMIARHPHVFAGETAHTPDAVVESWEKRKQDERAAKGQHSVLDGVAGALPALMRAEKLQRRASSVGFDWNNPDLVVAKIAEEAAEIVAARRDGAPQAEVAGEVGDLLFAVVNLARHLNVDPEDALRTCNAKFTQRFHHIERALADQGRAPRDATLAEMEALWQAAKTLPAKAP